MWTHPVSGVCSITCPIQDSCLYMKMTALASETLIDQKHTPDMASPPNRLVRLLLRRDTLLCYCKLVHQWERKYSTCEQIDREVNAELIYWFPLHLALNGGKWLSECLNSASESFLIEFKAYNCTAALWDREGKEKCSIAAPQMGSFEPGVVCRVSGKLQRPPHHYLIFGFYHSRVTKVCR